jgi:hypothetical protein
MIIRNAAHNQLSFVRLNVRCVGIVVLVVGLLTVLNVDFHTILHPADSLRLISPDALSQGGQQPTQVKKMRDQYRQNETRPQPVNRTAAVNIIDTDSDADEMAQQSDAPNPKDPIALMLKNSTDIIVNGVFRKMVRIRYCLCEIRI